MFESISLIFRSNFERIIVAGVIILASFMFAKAVKILMERFQKRNKHLAQTHLNFIKHFAVAGVYIIGFGLAIYMIPALRAFSVSILAGAGVLAIIVGFASQQAFSNVVSGMFIAIFEPFRIDDRIKVGEGVSGIVEDINLRHTVIRTYENKRVVIPNSIISNESIENGNIGEEKTVRFVDMGISYDSDIDKAMKIMVKEIEKHPLFMDNRDEEEVRKKKPKVTIKVIGFGDSSVNIRAFAWAATPRDAWAMGCDLNKSIKEKFDKAKIEIPFPYRTVVMKK